MMGRNLNGRLLKVEEFIAEVAWYAKLSQPGARLLREMISNLHIDVIRRDQIFASPALIDDFNQLVRDVDAPAVVPPIFKPGGQLVAGVVIEHIDIKFALTREPSESEI